MKKIERVVHPGWLTVTIESGGLWSSSHECLRCSLRITEAGGSEILLKHTREFHPDDSFALEMYCFAADLDWLDLHFGREALTWPDRFPTEYRHMIAGRTNWAAREGVQPQCPSCRRSLDSWLTAKVHTRNCPSLRLRWERLMRGDR